jgi:hypothetical protein
VLQRADAEAPMAHLRPCAPPEPTQTARRVEAARGPVPAGLGRAPERAEVSAAVLSVWASPQGGDTATGHGWRPPTPGGPGPSGQRGPRPRWTPGRPDPAAVTRGLAAQAPARRRGCPAPGRSALAARRSGLAGRDPPPPAAPSPPCALRPDPRAGTPRPPRPAPRASPLGSGASPLCPPRGITAPPCITSRLFCPTDAGCLNLPAGRAPRCRSPACWCRLRATKTFFRWATEERRRACMVACRACEQHKWQRWNTASAALTRMLAGMRATCASGGSRARGLRGQEHFPCTVPLCGL